MNSLEKYRLTMRILATLAMGLQIYVFKPSIGMGICHALFAYCIWFNRNRE